MKETWKNGHLIFSNRYYLSEVPYVHLKIKKQLSLHMIFYCVNLYMQIRKYNCCSVVYLLQMRKFWKHSFFPSKVNSSCCGSFFVVVVVELLWSFKLIIDNMYAPLWLLRFIMLPYKISVFNFIISVSFRKSSFSVSLKISIFYNNRERTTMSLIVVDLKNTFPSPIEWSWLNISVKQKKTNWQKINDRKCI